MKKTIILLFSLLFFITGCNQKNNDIYENHHIGGANFVIFNKTTGDLYLLSAVGSKGAYWLHTTPNGNIHIIKPNIIHDKPNKEENININDANYNQAEKTFHDLGITFDN